MPSILDAESWRIIMNTLHKIEKLLQKYLDKQSDKSDHPDFSKIQKRVNENVLNNPVVSEKYKEEMNRRKMSHTLPSHEIIRSVNPSTRTKLESNQKSVKKSVHLPATDLVKRETRTAEEMSDIYPDLEILRAALDSLFTSTFLYEDKILVEFLKGLGKMTISTLEESGVTKAIIPVKKKETAIFGIVRILEVTLINMNRIELIWDTVIMNELALISSCRHEWLTSIAMEAICVIIEELFDKRVRTEQLKIEMDIEEAYENRDEIDEEASLDEKWIKKIFEPLDKQMDTEFEKNKLIILRFIGNILQKHGNYLNNSIWKNILYLIMNSGKSKDKDCVDQGFKNLKLIVGDYVTRMSEDNIVLIIDTIFEFANNPTNKINNRLTAAGMFWNISDQVSKNYKQGFNRSVSEDSDLTPSNILNPGNILSNHVDHFMLWNCMFQKFHTLASCSQVEVRKHILK